MNQSPTDPFNLGLNVQATGWHYLLRYYARSDIYHLFRDLSLEKTKEVLGVSVLDNCRCWCTPSDKGCTPATTALKSYVEEFNEPIPFILCELFHVAIRDTGSSDPRITDWCYEVVRFLTFEALEMAHTCCEFTVVDRPDISSENVDVLMNCDPERWQKIRSGKREQENAALLENLMEEFIAYMMDMESSPRSLDIFVNGFWRQRISEIYAVDADEIKDMKNCLVGTKTYVLPDRVRLLLGKDFKLIELQDLKSELALAGETSHEEKGEFGDEFLELLPYKWC
ncbi:ankyrin repeats (3 copies) domain protein [Fusarium sp. NRRL 52700]|nr:ankyrin repeats (3 copies) domain protein [Fusarium sp. NRRL 52700]